VVPVSDVRARAIRAAYEADNSNRTYTDAEYAQDFVRGYTTYLHVIVDAVTPILAEHAVIIAMPLSLADIDAFVDAGCEYRAWDRNEWENTGTELLHLPSNAAFVPGDEWVTDDMRVIPGDEL